ncbi:MAG: hypothetical protein IK088_04685 [Lachnospiraceae bacterium]|nr:hypothetical protein [Lachnospiraceae bacterium]
MAILLSVPASAKQTEVSFGVQAYAEKTAFPEFVESNPLMYATNVPPKNFRLGEGFRIYTTISSPYADTFLEYIDDKYFNYFFVLSYEGDVLGNMGVRQDNGNGVIEKEGDYRSMGVLLGGNERELYESIEKMRELIRKSGCSGDPTIVLYNLYDYLIYFDFGADERIIHVGSPLNFNKAYLEVNDYHELPTGKEVLNVIQKNEEEYKAAVEANGGQPLYGGGADLSFSLHEYRTFPVWIWFVIAAAVSVLVIGIFLMVGGKKKSMKKTAVTAAG